MTVDEETFDRMADAMGEIRVVVRWRDLVVHPRNRSPGSMEPGLDGMDNR